MGVDYLPLLRAADCCPGQGSNKLAGARIQSALKRELP